MNLSEDTYWQIQDFLQGKLKGADLAEFQSRLSSDSDLKLEVELHKCANKLITDKKLQNISAISLKTQSKIKQNILIKKIGIATSIVIASIGIITYILNPIQINPITKETPDSTLKISNKKETFEAKNGELDYNIDFKKAEDNMPLILKNDSELIDSVSNQEEDDSILTQSKVSFTNNDVQTRKVMNEYTKTTENICDNVNLNASVTVKQSCINESNGIIYVNNFEGGKAPYHFKILSAYNKEVSSQQVPKGKYEVVISDVNDCQRIYSDILIREIVCLEEEKSFNPSLGEILDLGESKLPVTLTVVTKNGTIRYSKEFIQNEKIEWNGITNNGNIETGYYIYYLKYSDETVKQGEVTVTQ